MGYKTETEQVSAQALNANFIRKIDQGHIKEAQDVGTAFIRSIVRQESYAREVIKPVLITDDELDISLTDDEPQKIVEKEPDSTAVMVPFLGAGPMAYVTGRRYAIRFGKTESQHAKKSKFQLMTYQNDIRKIIADNFVKDMADQEDRKWQETVDAIVALNPAQTTTAAAFNSTPFKQAGQALVDRRRPVGKMTMTKSLFMEAMDLPATVIGNDPAAKHYNEGVEKEEQLYGIPVITNIKSDIHSTKKAYLYAPEDFLGKYYLLQDATLYIKQEADMLTFWTYAAMGAGIGNILSIQAIDFSAI